VAEHPGIENEATVQGIQDAAAGLGVDASALR
jgi:hypothetical protein